MKETRYRAVFKKTNDVSTNSYTIQELADFYEHEWEFSDGSILPGNDVADGDLIYNPSTGIKDKHGREIFGGDIVKVLNFVAPVEYIDGKAHFEPRQIVYEMVEVIGNIYENPELLKKKGSKNGTTTNVRKDITTASSK
jgi:hypothetical protein